MSQLPAPPRRLALAISAAVASTTLAVGVSTASLLGWFAPASPRAFISAEPAASPPVILVPITPSAPAPAATPLQTDLPDADLQLAVDEHPRRHDDEPDHDEGHEHDDRHEDDDE